MLGRSYRGPRGAAVVVGGLVLFLLLLSTTISPGSVASTAALPPTGGSVPSPTPNGNALGALSSAPLIAVPDSEPGIGLPGAVDHGPAQLTSMTILVAFPLSHESELLGFLSLISDSHSSLYHHYLTQAQFDAQYGGASAPYQLAVQYFDSIGVTQLTTSADRLVITFQASAAQVESIFHTQIDSYSLGSRTYYAPTGHLVLPEPLAQAITTVEGLSS